MATSFSKKVSGLSAEPLESGSYAKYTWTETGTGLKAGANTFIINNNTGIALLSLTGTEGDTLKINGYSGDYAAKLSGSKLILESNNQTITVTLAVKSIITLNFLDGDKTVDFSVAKAPTLNGVALKSNKTLYIAGVTSHEAETLKTVATKVATDAKIAADKAAATLKAATDAAAATLKAATDAAAATLKAATDAAAVREAAAVKAAIDATTKSVADALASTGFTSITDLIADRAKLLNLPPPPAFKVEAINTTVKEGDVSAFKISLTNRSTGDYTVKTTLTGLGATSGLDYDNSLTLDSASSAAGITFNSASGILTIPATSQAISAKLSTAIKIDQISDLGEKVNLALSDAIGTKVTALDATANANVAIIDIPPPTFNVSSATSVSEGATASFTINLANRSTATGDYTVMTKLEGTGTGATKAILGTDFNPLTQLSLDAASIKAGVTLDANGVLKIPATAASISNVILSVAVTKDTLTETGEGMRLTLSSPTGTNVLLGTTVADMAITDVPMPTFSISGSSVAVEGTNASFVVNLANKPNTGDYTVMTTLDGMGGAIGGTGTNADFYNLLSLDAVSTAAKITLINGLLTIPAASTVSSVTLTSAIASDTLTPETGEGLRLTLSSPTGTNAMLDSDPARLVVNTSIADVPPPTFSVTGSSAVSEGSNASFVINLANKPTTGSYSVTTTFAPTGGATPGTDYTNALTLDSTSSAAGITFVAGTGATAGTGVLTIPATSSVNSVTLTSKATPDLLTETGEGMQLTLSIPTGADNVMINSALTSALISILDVAPPTFTVSAPNATVSEGNNSTFTVNLANRVPGSEYTVTTTLVGTGTAPITLNSSVANNIVSLKTNVLDVSLDKTDPDFSSSLTLDTASTFAGITLTTIAGITVLKIPSTSTVSSVTLSTPVKTDFVTPETGEGLSLTLSSPSTNAILGSTIVAPITIQDTTNTVLTSGMDALTGTYGPSTFTATGLTLNEGDSIVDAFSGDGDVLNITTDRPINKVSITKIETINLTALNAISVNMAAVTGPPAYTGITGVSAFNINNSTGAVILTNIPAPLSLLEPMMVIGLSGSGVNTVDATYSTSETPGKSVTIGQNDKLLINLNTANNADIIVRAPFVDGTNTKAYESFETAEINVLGQSSITNYKLFNGATTYLPALTISGSGALTIGADALRGVTDIYITDTAAIKIGQISATATAPVIATPLKILNALSAGTITTDNIAGSTLGITALFNSNSDSITITSGATGTSINTIKLGAGTDTLNFTSIATGTSYLFGEADNDIINVTGGAATTYIDGGAGNDTITSGSGTNNTITGGDGADTFTSSGTDTITDFILTGTGADTLTINSSGSARVYPYLASTGGTLSFSAINNSGTLRIDGSTVYGGVPITGSEIITGSTGKDSITGGTGNDSLEGGAGNDTINGGAGNDTIIGGQGSDSLDGGAGDDTFMTSSILFTADTIDGNDGTDTLSFTDTDSFITFSTANLSNLSNIEKIITAANPLAINIAVTTSAANQNSVGLKTIDLSGDTNALGTNVVSSTGANGLTTIIGSAGIDTITLGTSAPATTITGGSGADAFSINNGSSTVVTITDFLPGTDTLSIAILTTVQVYSSTAINGMNYAGVSNSGTLYIDGSAVTGAQTIIGGAGKDSIVGGSGTDEITSGAGADTINGGAGNDTFLFNTNDAASGETINDSNGTADTIKVLTSTDFSSLNTMGTTTLSAMGIEQILITSGQTATFTGAQLTGQVISVNATAVSLANLIITATTNATTDLSALTFTAQANPAVGNAFDTGVDTVTINGAGGTNTINGTTIADTITGTGTGTDTIDGKAGADTISGGAGSDVITGGTGADKLTGDAGNDTFVITTGDGSAFTAAAGTFTGYDTITDFTTTADTIKYLASAAVETSAGKQVALDNKAYVFANNQSVNSVAVTTLAAADFANVDKVITYINAVASNTAGANMDFIVAVNDATAGKAAIYHVANTAGDAIIATEVELIGVTTGVVAAVDFVA